MGSFRRCGSFRPRLESLERRDLLATFTVLNTGDAATGSLRQAILDANGNAGADTIEFNIAGSGVHTISPTSALPIIAEPVLVDGNSQPGFSGVPLIELNGTSAGVGVSGIVISGSNSTVRGLTINGFSLSGLLLSGAGATGNTIQGNYIGTNAAGTGALPNGVGVKIEQGASGNTIGGTLASARNVISGNTNEGVRMVDSGTAGNLIRGNFIGTNAMGNAPIGNASGVVTTNGSGPNTIGGTVTGARNIVSGNLIDGVNVVGDPVLGNYIGTDVTGTFAVANGDTGVAVGGGGIVGGTSIGAGNVISGNGARGISVGGLGAMIQGNYIGTNALGTAALSNGTGVSVAAGNVVIGGTTANARNVISGNATGVLITNFSTNILLHGNYIGTDYAGTAAVANGIGVAILNGSHDNFVGGTSTDAGNLISGNSNIGVSISGSNGTANNSVQGNYIGTDVTGMQAVGNTLDGVLIADGATNNTIGGTVTGARNIISGNGVGIRIDGPSTSGNVVQGNYVGTTVSGTMALANFDGVFITAANNTVGGTAMGAGNLISGNGRAGVYLSGTEAIGNVIQGNMIGLDVTGDQQLGNMIGVQVFQGAKNNIVGGTVTTARNVISGNKRAGVAMGGNGTTGNIVQGNYIGIDAAGSLARGNPTGVTVFRFASNNIIGGTVAGEGNVISGNTGSGVAFRMNGTTGNQVIGNRIGTDASGTAAIPNNVGVGSSESASGNIIGGTTAGAGNVIAYSAAEGVRFDTGTGNSIRGNNIFKNDGVGILLLNGANINQPFPVITSVTSGGGNATINGTLTAAVNTTYAIDLSKNVLCDPSGFGEGEVYLGSITTTTDGSGMASFTGMFSGELLPGRIVTATATDPSGNTSEFSACFVVPMPPAPGRGIDSFAGSTAVPSIDVFEFGVASRPQRFSSGGDTLSETRIVFQTVIETGIPVSKINASSCQLAVARGHDFAFFGEAQILGEVILYFG